MAPTFPDVVRFGVFEFNPATGELWKQGTRVPLEPQPSKALAHLLTHAGTIVSRESLKAVLWNGEVHVDFDRGLAYCIAQVRTALGDSADNPRFVETLPRRGFRFIAPMVPMAPIAPVASTGSPMPPTMAAPSRARAFNWRSPRMLALAALAVFAVVVTAVSFGLVAKRPTLAVAIFDNETGRPELDAVTSGLSDALVIHLAALDVEKVGVIGNARSLRMPRSERDLIEIAAETGAQFILLGQLQVLDDQPGGLRLLTHIIRLSDGTHVWVQRFDRPGGSLDGVEAEMLAAAEDGVRQKVIGASTASSPDTTSR